MVRQIMAEHEGEVGFESQAGQGTTFYLRLPLVQPDKPQPAETGGPSLAPGQPIPEAKNGRILLIEDDQPLGKVLQRILETLGHQVSLASGGKEGLELFRAERGKFDIIFTD